MAKQRGSGVVAAAARVSDTQGKFQDVGGQFMTGYNKSLEAKKAKEAESEAAQGRVNALMDGFTNDVDVLKFKPEDQKVVKDKITVWRNEYANAANAAARIKDKSSSEYQQYVDIMNGVQSKMVSLKGNIDNLAAFKGEYTDNIKAGTYSISGQNAMALAQGETMVTSPIGSITDSGDLEWAAGTGSVRDGFSFEDYSMPFGKANDVAGALGTMADAQQNRTMAMTELGKEGLRNKVGKLFDNPDALASFIADNEMEDFDFRSIDPENPNAKDEVVDIITESLFDIGIKSVASKNEGKDTRTTDQKNEAELKNVAFSNWDAGELTTIPYGNGSLIATPKYVREKGVLIKRFNISYIDADGDIMQESFAPLPSTTSFDEFFGFHTGGIK